MYKSQLGQPRLLVSHGIGWKLFSLLAMALTAVSDGYQSLSDHPIVKTLPFRARGVVQSLVGKLRSHMPQGQKNPKQTIKQKQYCNKFNKDLKRRGHILFSLTDCTYCVHAGD